MKYDAHLSHLLNVDTFVNDRGAIYIKPNSNQYYIGKLGTTIGELRLTAATYI